ncbi:MAG: Tyrosine-tRNA ligase [Candidatus Woesebacteria bacterium GW2011_GWB1_39_10b]|uniref:Tyrosine--tRNA ligase n=2 Tax=Candidatus Woeseibacteriota TaxID=1752722 RepID=A0A0G0NFG5_9BACT|nr:MAG: Tyrosine-tRNA ligase [Microgenomates group bacterium GW2011_GWC1_38_12]KKQ94291.1 MAG: Tyrosine-tRNA ligase [Candidatus Woesebacteria bacterium GW2011_GWB1_39_10b]KKR14228.1 MAG: Tyrosine-tRNA ligase [Candidatus Woesebacteria bacterium GW2011_GWA1_39_21b]
MDKIDEVLTRGVEQILPSKEGLAELMGKKKITLYQGFDPSMPSLHLGNYVGLMKLRQFQKLGHKVIFLVGDFTGMIGDPSDKLAVRKKLSRDEVLENSKKYKEQASKVIFFEGENPAEIKYNSEWSDKVNFKDLIEITSSLTVQQMIERDMYQERLKQNKPIYLHEFLYPVAQGYDSVAMNVDLEIGGSDQIFNMLAGRTLMKAMKGKEKFVLATKLLVDKEGNKVGKTTGNALFLDTTAENFFAGIMSFPDEVIELGFELLTEVELDGLVEKVKSNPMGEKKRLAHEVVNILWGEGDAKKAQGHFEKNFQENKPEFRQELAAKETLVETISQLVGSMSEAKRLIAQEAVEINNLVVTNPTMKIRGGEEIKVGKKIFIKIKKGL